MSKRMQAPLSRTQAGIYVECMANTDSTMYNLPFLAKLGESIDTDRLKEAIRKVIEAHPCLETVIHTEENGDVVQRIEKGSFKLPEYHMTDEEFEEARKKLVRPFVLNGGSLCRYELYHTPSASYLFQDIHHIIIDGTCHGRILAVDLRKAYDGEEPEAESYTGLDVAADEAALYGTEEYNCAKEYFERLLEGCDGDCLPVPDRFEDTPSQGWVRYRFVLDQDLFKTFRKEKGVSTTAFFTCVMGFLTARYNYRDDSVIATIYDGRREEKKKNVVSMLVKTLPFVTDLSGNPTVAELVKKANVTLMECRENDLYSFEEMAARYGINADINFAFQGKLLEYSLMAGSDMQIERIYDEKHIENTPLLFELSDLGDGVYELHAGYRADMFSRTFAENMCHAYGKAAQEFLIRDHVDDVNLADEDSRKQLDGFNATEHAYDTERTVIDLFRQQAALHQERDALVYLDKHFTYGELDEITDRLAGDLKKKGIGRDTVAAVLIPRCQYMVICALGILKAGGGYLPLDATYPPERLNLMVKDSGAKVLLTTPELNAIIHEEFTGIRMMVDEIPDLPRTEEALLGPQKEDLFIMLYTSGSTGLPKGVMLEHGNLMAFCDWARRYYQMDENTKSAAYASYGFDANMFDTYPVLTAGGTLYIIDEAIRLDLIRLQEYYNENKITHSLITTQVGRQFAMMEGTVTMKHLTVGGEKLVPLNPPDYYLHNAYGPTECTILVTTAVVDRKFKDVPIGPAISNVKLYVVDKNGKLLPPGAAGELWIAGPQVARSYLNRPEQTAAAFSVNPFCNREEYAKIYHTGDVVRFMEDGSVQFIGRRDAQVKVRGFRIELTEVEEVIRRFDGIQDATVAAYDDPAGGKYLVAYVVSEQEIRTEDLNEFIMKEKPPYMVPAVTMQIDKIPMTQNQKVNKRALPVPERKFEDVKAPENEMQQKIFDIVADVIGNDGFGINTDIYLAGLTSVGAVRLNVLLSKAFDKAVRTQDLKEHDTVEKLEKFFLEEDTQEELVLQEDYPLTKNQEGIFIETMAHPDSTIYNIPILLEIADCLDMEKLQMAVAQAVEAHPYMKTQLFTDEKENIRQKRMDTEVFFPQDVEILTWKDFDPKTADLVKPFALLNSRLFRIKLIKGRKNYLFVEMHHIISDGTSMNIFLNDITKAYEGEKLHQEIYSGFEAAALEEKQRKNSIYDKAADYYKGLLEGCDADCLPAGDLKEEKQESAELTYEGCYAMPEDVKHFCRVNRLSMNGFFTAVFSLVLSKYAGKEETVFATIYNGRNDSRLDETVAMLVKTFPVKGRIGTEQKDCPVTAYVSEIADQLMESMANDIYSFGEISRKFGVHADVMFAYQGENFRFDKMCGQSAKLIRLQSDQAKAPLNLNVFLEDGRIKYSLEYRSDRYSRAYAEGFLDAMDQGVFEFLTRQTIGEISILSDKAWEEMKRFNDTEGRVENLTVPQMLEKQALLHPDKAAVIAGKVTLTFKELNQRANKIANELLVKEIKKQQIVALYMNRAVDVYSIRQGILKAGAAFLSIDPEYPQERITYILENAGAEYLITMKPLYQERKEMFDALHVHVLFLEDIYQSDQVQNPEVEIDPAALAYCIYTSGSTGKPKGVMIEHRNLMNMLAYHAKNILAKDYVDHTTVFLGLAAITFDVSIIEEMMPICHGQTVAMATEEEIHNPILLAEMMEETGVDMMKCTPSYMITMLDFAESSKVLSQLTAIIIGAEPFPEGLYEKMRAAGLKGKIFNSYGPTETTVTVTIDELDGKHITIGRPAGNTGIYMVDAFGHILPKFVRGELLITGESVGRGYIGLDEQTKEKFIVLNGQKAYRSGDIAYWSADGRIVHCGRRDNQVKLRGLRVELDEIENVMNRFKGIKRSVVLVKGEGNDQKLCGYYVAEEPVNTQELAEFMGKTLTAYMIPAVFVHMTSMPMTANGKVDKKALPEPAAENKKRQGREAKTEIEKKFCDMFAVILGIDKVYADDDFFALGGTSLSASKVAMKCMTEKINVAYGDVFQYPTPEKLAAYIEKQFAEPKETEPAAEKDVALAEDSEQEKLHEVLKYNSAEYLEEMESTDLGNVLVTGATGFLGIHVVMELLEEGCNKIFCLVRKGKNQSAQVRLKSMFMYYFDDTMESEIGKRIIPVEGDITDDALEKILKGYEIDTIINCAACVKHFVADDLLDRVNVQGVKNLIRFSMKYDKKLIQVSTVSVAGESVDGHIPPEVKLTENRLEFSQALDNKYAKTKFLAEKAVLEAVANGLRGKVIRVGNLMSRERDGEFQINYTTNGFMNRLRAYSIIGKFPVNDMDQEAEFSPIDSTAKALVRLAGTPDKFTVFHAYNCHHVHMANVLKTMNEYGIRIDVVKEEEFRRQFDELLADETRNAEISSLIAYMNSGKANRRYVGWENHFTVKALYRLGFSWPLTGERYIRRAVDALSTLGFFDGEEDE